MSSVMNPIGPEEPATYWRRRAAVVAVLIVVLLLGWFLIRAATGSSDEPAADGPTPVPSFGLSVSPEPSDALDPSVDPSEASDVDASGAPSASASPTPSPTPSTPCRKGDVEVSVEPASASTPVGAGMRVTMSVTNTGKQACTRDVGAGANEVRITSGPALVWSSDFCDASDATDVVVLEPGEPWTTSVRWKGTVVSAACPDKPPTAQPGTYRVVARNGTLESSEVRFTVS